MPVPRTAPASPIVAPADPPTDRAPGPAVATLRAFGRGVLVGAVVVSALLGAEFDFGVPRIVSSLLMGFLGFAFVSAGEGVVVLLWSVLRGLFRRLRFERGLAAVRTVPAVPIGRILGAFVYVAGDALWPQSFFKQVMLPVVGEIAIVLTGLTFVAVALARREHRSRAARVALVAAPALAIAAFAWWVADPGFDGYLVAAPVRASSSPLADPGATGPFAVRTLAYGSGANARRPEYGEAADLRTTSVDGTPVFAGYGGPAGAFFRWYWGFGFDALPLDGLVWYPEGDGPFPLVLVVHGNHAMSEPSEPGYAYLGEHLASQGYVVAAIDQNFLNGLVFFDGHFAEMPLRAWMILQHVQQWRRWNETPGNPFAGRVDLERVALVGHSRGGEAVAWAAHLNEHAVSGVSTPSDFGFGIGAVVAIAPSDAYLGPNDRRPDLGDADYLLLAGGHDGDTHVLYGQAAFARAASGADPSTFQALAYVHRANHGQFNAIWGDRDRGLYHSLLLNRAPLLSADAQQQTAKALVTSFLHASLRGDAAYRAPFANPPTGSGWLPAGAVVTQLRGAGSVVVQGFEDGGPAADGDAANARIEALLLRDGASDQGNRALRLAWAAGSPRVHEIALAPEDVARWAPTPALSFALASVPGAAPPSELVVELEAADGASVRWTLDDGEPLVPALPAHLVKARWLYGLAGLPGAMRPEEVVLQTFTVPLAAFEGAPLEPTDLVAVRFAFTGADAGAVYLDEVALAGE